MEKLTPKHSAFEQALRFLDRRALSEAELHKKMQRYAYTASEISAAVYACRQRGFINDSLLISDFRDELFSRGNGPRMIKAKLRRRGLDPNAVSAALEETRDQETDSCRIAAEYKLRLLTRENDMRKKREKLYRHLAGRGFSTNVISQIISEKKEAFMQ